LTCVRWLARWCHGKPTETVLLAIRAGKAPALARRGEAATTDIKLPAGFAVYAVAFGDLHSAAEEITQHAADVVVLEPAELARFRGTRPDSRRSIGKCSVTSRAQVRRLLSLVPYLREHDGVAMTEAAAAFGISLKTLREDLSVLWMCGMPGLTPGDLIDIDMDAVDGEGCHPPQQRRLPHPAVAALGRRSTGAGAGAPYAA
jgi:predicted DNA-binding transcriptional regulator YafY